MSSPNPFSLIDHVIDGRYRVLSHLADGGMATVYIALDERLDRRVALKVMRADLAKDESFVQRFRREARSAAKLSHPNVVAVYDQGEDGGSVFLAMELVSGLTLRQVMQSEGPMTPRSALDIIEPVLQALGAAHSAGLIHRDVKPENVILREDGAVKVADFGLARAIASTTSTAQTGVLLGTVAYLSPEQVERGLADARSDVYAAGLLLFEMLTGSKAYIGDSPIHVAYQHVHSEVPPPSSRVSTVPAALDSLVLRASQRDPDNRPRDANELLAEVRRSRLTLSPAELDQRPPAASGAALNATMVIPRVEVASEVGTSARTESAGTGPAYASVNAASVNATSVNAGSTNAGPSEPGSPQTEMGTGPARHLPRLGPGRQLSVVLLLTALVLVAAALIFFFVAGPGANAAVPQVVGSTSVVAQNALALAHLDARVVRSFSETVRAGLVLAGDPRAGSMVPRGSTVTLKVSQGPERHEVPQIVGRTQAEAQQRVTDARLTVGSVTRGFSETVPQGQVISTSPVAGTALRRFGSVAMLISRGRQPITVADWTGQPVDKAVTALTTARLKVDATTQTWSDTVPKGSVISQAPPSGTLFAGDLVTLVTSKGPVLVQVPNVIGQQEGPARSVLKSLGFEVKIRRALGGFFRTVRFQSIPGETEAPRGSTITLTVV